MNIYKTKIVEKNGSSVEYWTDGRNFVNTSYADQNKAAKMLGSLIECEGCINCKECSNCKKCIGCSFCDKCFICINCHHSNECKECSGCMFSSGCRKCTNCYHCTNCRKEKEEFDKYVYTQ